MGFSPVRNALLRSPLHCGNETFLEAQVRDGLFPPAVPFKLLGESHKYILEIWKMCSGFPSNTHCKHNKSCVKNI